jgi:hypothetical protein
MSPGVGAKASLWRLCAVLNVVGGDDEMAGACLAKAPALVRRKEALAGVRFWQSLHFKGQVKPPQVILWMSELPHICEEPVVVVHVSYEAPSR